MIISFGAGGQTDIAVRLLTKIAKKELGVPLIIVNRPGGGATLGVVEISRSTPDGYTIGTLNIGTMTVNPMIQKVAYDSFKDFDYICGFGQFLYGIYARTDSPFSSIKDVVEAARLNPKKISYGTMA